MSQPVRPLLAVAVAALLAVAGCGGSGGEKIDAAKAEDFVRTQAAGDAAGLKSVDCPEVEQKKGKPIVCKLAYEDGSEEEAILEQTDDKGSIKITGNRQTKLPPNAGNLTIKPENVEALIRSRLTKPAEAIKCPSGLKPKTGQEFDCTVSFEDGTREKAVIKQVDDLVNLTVARVEPLE